MAHWNHRVIRHSGKDGEPDYLKIHEVHYESEDDSNPSLVTEDGVSVGGETIEDIMWVLDRMKEALAKPILDFESLD